MRDERLIMELRCRNAYRVWDSMSGATDGELEAESQKITVNPTPGNLVRGGVSGVDSCIWLSFGIIGLIDCQCTHWQIRPSQCLVFVLIYSSSIARRTK